VLKKTQEATEMKKAFKTEQIIEVLKEAESGVKVPEICRKHGISDATFYTWRKKYRGMEKSEAKEYKRLEDENRKLKRIIADQALDIQMLRDVVSKKW
jgi:putative transposase